jgi:hypothetical protein
MKLELYDKEFTGNFSISGDGIQPVRRDFSVQIYSEGLETPNPGAQPFIKPHSHSPECTATMQFAHSLPRWHGIECLTHAFALLPQTLILTLAVRICISHNAVRIWYDMT